MHARRWHDAGYSVVLVVQAPNIDLSTANVEFAHVIVRENRGYDFAAWATAIRHIPFFDDTKVVALVNDSIYGPGDGFEIMLERVERSSADVVATVESRQNGWHLQSFLLFFKASAINSEVFRAFWQNIRLGGRRYVIDRYELRLGHELRAAGLTIETLFPSPAGYGNPTLSQWKALIERGFPYVKRQLLRTNPTEEDLDDWRMFLANKGFNVDLIEADLRGT